MEHISGPVARLLGNIVLSTSWQAQFEREQKAARKALAAYLEKPCLGLIAKFERSAEAAQIAAYRAECARQLEGSV